jgi:hypothetical protein
MFLVRDTIQNRHEKIRSFLDKEPAIAVLLAVADFEWTVRRAILACGRQSMRELRERALRQCHGPIAYAECWHREVTPRFGKELKNIIPDWEFFRKDAFQLRHNLIHGVQGTAGIKYARKRVESMIAASKAIAEAAAENGAQIYGARIRRVKSL